MSVRFNPMFLSQSTFDSASPVGSAVLVHRFDNEGEYDVELGREGEVPDRVTLSITAGREEGTATASVTIDAAPAAAGTVPGQRRSKLGAGGFASFTSSHAGGAGSVIVVRRRDAKEVEFDSRRLGEADLFAVTLVRPGLYGVRNTLGKAEGRVVVSYPVVGDRPYRPADPVHVVCTETGFEPERVEIGPAQGIIFRFRTAARLLIELLEPDDGPEPGPRGRASSKRGPSV